MRVSMGNDMMHPIIGYITDLLRMLITLPIPLTDLANNTPVTIISITVGLI
jgi:hypothetical protein